MHGHVLQITSSFKGEGEYLIPKLISQNMLIRRLCKLYNSVSGIPRDINYWLLPRCALMEAYLAVPVRFLSSR